MDWKKKTILFYSLGGLILGVFAGIITINNAVEKDKEVDISLKEGAKIGISALNSLQKYVLK